MTAPESVSTIIFELRVNDGHDDSLPDLVQLNVMEHTGEAIYVAGDDGSDAGDGTRYNPYATISGAINRVSGPDQDIYVMSRADNAGYEESEITSAQVGNQNSRRHRRARHCRAVQRNVVFDGVRGRVRRRPTGCFRAGRQRNAGMTMRLAPS